MRLLPNAFALNPRRRQALCSVIDTLIAPRSVVSEEAGFWRSKASDLDVDKHIIEAIGRLPYKAREDFSLLLGLLASPLPGLLLNGWPASFASLSQAKREKLLLRWSSSNLPMLRAAFATLKRSACFIYYGSSRDGYNPSWRAINYPGPPKVFEQMPARRDERSAANQAPLSVVTKPPELIECDTLVIGSGAGGGVVAGTLAQAGHDVVVIDRGHFVDLPKRSGLEHDMITQLYDGGGLLATQDHAISLLAGSCLGGGTTVNWSVCLSPGETLLQEWACQHKLPHLLGDAFKRCIDDVCKSVNVSEARSHNAVNNALMRGSKRLGYRSGALPQNVCGCDQHNHDHCGFCLFGCRYGNKQDVIETFLRRAQQKGVRIYANLEAHKLHRKGRQVTQLDAYLTKDGEKRPVTLRANKFVLAGGALRTPALLRFSGFSHPQIGQNLYLHPVTLVLGRYSQPVESWRGAMMTSYSDAVSNQDGLFYGCKIEPAPLHSGFLGSILPWRGAEMHKQAMLDAAYYCAFAVITRDKYPGRIDTDRMGQPKVRYRFRDYDRKHNIAGMASAAAIHAAANATRVVLTHHDGRFLDTDKYGIHPQLYHEQINRLDWAPNRFPLFSAHQMGSCRMGGDIASYPVMPDGRLGETDNLYIADGSVFPSSSGINPVITIQALARHTALEIAAQSS